KEICIRPLQQSSTDEHSYDLSEVVQEKEQILHDAQLKAQALNERAQNEYNNTLQEIERLREQFEVEKEENIKETKIEAFKAGLEEGKESGYLEYAGLLAEANQIVEQSKIAFKSHVESSEKTILELAIEVAERILTK